MGNQLKRLIFRLKKKNVKNYFFNCIVVKSSGSQKEGQNRYTCPKGFEFIAKTFVFAGAIFDEGPDGDAWKKVLQLATKRLNVNNQVDFVDVIRQVSPNDSYKAKKIGTFDHNKFYSLLFSELTKFRP